MASAADPAGLTFNSKVEVVEQLGSEILLDVRVGDDTMVAAVDPTIRAKVQEHAAARRQSGAAALLRRQDRGGDSWSRIPSPRLSSEPGRSACSGSRSRANGERSSAANSPAARQKLPPRASRRLGAERQRGDRIRFQRCEPLLGRVRPQHRHERGLSRRPCARPCPWRLASPSTSSRSSAIWKASAQALAVAVSARRSSGAARPRMAPASQAKRISAPVFMACSRSTWARPAAPGGRACRTPGRGIGRRTMPPAPAASARPAISSARTSASA